MPRSRPWGSPGLSSFLLEFERPLHIAAGLFLIWLGLTDPARARRCRAGWRRTAAASWPAAFGSAVLLTLTNPPTIIMFAAIFTALVPPSGLTAASAAATVGGVFAGSLLWWCGIVGTVTLVSPRAGSAHTALDRPRRRAGARRVRAAGTAPGILGLLRHVPPRRLRRAQTRTGGRDEPGHQEAEDVTLADEGCRPSPACRARCAPPPAGRAAAPRRSTSLCGRTAPRSPPATAAAARPWSVPRSGP